MKAGDIKAVRHFAKKAPVANLNKSVEFNAVGQEKDVTLTPGTYTVTDTVTDSNNTENVIDNYEDLGITEKSTVADPAQAKDYHIKLEKVKSAASKAKKIVFGTEADYPNVVSNAPANTSTYGAPRIVDVKNTGGIKEYDVIESNGAESVYFLTDNAKQKVIAPKNCNGMFAGGSKVINLDLSNFDTSEVTNMESMFSNCFDLTSLDVSNFNTSNVTNMKSMFHGCLCLTSLDLSNFDTSKVTSMNNMFSGCSDLTSLDVSSFDVSATVKEQFGMFYMFYDCSKLTTIYTDKDWNTDINQPSDIFTDCSSLVGGSGVKYDSSKTDIAMANPTTGYFTAKS